MDMDAALTGNRPGDRCQAAVLWLTGRKPRELQPSPRLAEAETPHPIKAPRAGQDQFSDTMIKPSEPSNAL
jgi:hypothetical protein